jgi:hypothetical protein
LVSEAGPEYCEIDYVYFLEKLQVNRIFQLNSLPGRRLFFQFSNKSAVDFLYFSFDQRPFVAPIFKPDGYRALILTKTLALENVNETHIPAKFSLLLDDGTPNIFKGDASVDNQGYVPNDRGIFAERPIDRSVRDRGESSLQVDLGNEDRLAEFVAGRDLVT